MRFTDPSGYMAQGCGYTPNWLQASNQIAHEQANWNNQFGGNGKDWLTRDISHRFRAGGGGGNDFAMTTGFGGYGELSLSDFGLPGGDIVGMNLIAQINGIPIHLKTTIGANGYWIEWHGGVETKAIIKINEKGEEYMELPAHNVYSKFVPFGDGGNDGDNTESGSGLGVSFNHGILQFETNFINKDWGAITPGPFVIYSKGGAKTKYYNTHEPGHVLEFEILGVNYYFFVALPSLFTAKFYPGDVHNHMPWEESANQLWYWFSGESDPANPKYTDPK